MARSSGVLTLVLGLSSVAVAVWWLRRPDPPAPAEAGRPPFQLPVTLAQVERGTLRPRALLTGTVKNPGRADLAFELQGVLVEVGVRRADHVEEGQVVARLRSVDQDLDVSQAEADLELAARELQKLQAGTRAEEVQRLAADLAERTADRDLARSELARGRQLFDEKVVSQADLDRRQAELDGATARMQAAEALLAEARAGARQEDLAIAQAKVDAAQVRLASARRELDKTRLVAPRAGIVVKRLAAVGDTVAAGSPIVEIVDLSDLEIEVEIPGRLAREIAPDAAAVVTADDLPDWRLETRIDARVPSADEVSRNFAGLLRLDPEDGAVDLLEPGMFVRVDVALRAVEDALIVPSDAVLRTDAGQKLGRAVAAAEGGGLSAQLLDVRVVAVEGARSAIEVLGEPEGAPLAAGDSIVVTGIDRAFPGAPLLPPRPAEGPQGGGAGR